MSLVSSSGFPSACFNRGCERFLPLGTGNLSRQRVAGNTIRNWAMGARNLFPMPHMPRRKRALDQYSFVKHGIASLFIFPGLDSQAALKEFNAERYHKPSDDLSHALFFESGVTWARIQLLVTEKLLTVKERPRLNPDGFLGQRFGGAARPRPSPP